VLAGDTTVLTLPAELVYCNLTLFQSSVDLHGAMVRLTSSRAPPTSGKTITIIGNADSRRYTYVFMRILCT